MADAEKRLNIVIQAQDEASRTLASVSTNFQNVGRDARNAGLLLTGVGAATGLLAKGMVDAAGKMEATRTAFKVLIGDSEEAERTLKQLFELEARTPFTLESILNESKKLLAMGTDAKDLTKTLEALGDVAAGVGFEKLPQLTLAFGQIQAKGRLTGMELRQLTEAGFNLADAMGISNDKLEQLISDKAVKFEDVRKAFETVTSEGGRFDGMMANLAQTTPGRISTMESSIFKLKAAFGEALLPAVNQIIDALLPLMEHFAVFAQQHQTLIALVISAGLVLGVLGTALLILGPIITGVTGIIGLLSAAVQFATLTATILGALLTGPMIVALLLVGATVAALAVMWKNNFGDIRGNVTAVVDYFKGPWMNNLRGWADLIRQVIHNVRAVWVDAFNAMASAVNNIINAVRGAIDALRNLASARASGGGSFQHGGFVPGAGHQAVPALLHGGERIIPRTGTDVNPSGGGAITINFTGPVAMDSSDRVDELAKRIINILGRQNELAAKGLSI